MVGVKDVNFIFEFEISNGGMALYSWVIVLFRARPQETAFVDFISSKSARLSIPAFGIKPAI
jgi:hypothetical protein